jgi:hypothetical protein
MNPIALRHKYDLRSTVRGLCNLALNRRKLLAYLHCQCYDINDNDDNVDSAVLVEFGRTNNQNPRPSDCLVRIQNRRHVTTVRHLHAETRGINRYYLIHTWRACHSRNGGASTTLFIPFVRPKPFWE